MRRLPARLKLVADAEGPLLELVVRQGGIGLDLARAAIERGGAHVEKKRVRDPAAPVRRGARVEVMLRAAPAVELSRERILHLDDLVLAIDKPPGIAAQEDLAGGPSLPALCSELLRKMGERETQVLLVHRLDRGTSGVTLFARTRRAQAALLAQFRRQQAEKEYRALVGKAPAQDQGVVESAIESRPASTRYRVLQRLLQGALLAAFPRTGRTHQVRIHFRELGCPLLGDKPYGGAPFVTRPDGGRHEFSRPMLHALSLSLTHPRGGRLFVTAVTPADFESARAFLERP